MMELGGKLHTYLFGLDFAWLRHIVAVVTGSTLPSQPTAGLLLLSPEALGLMPSSPLFRILLLLDRLLPFRISLGSRG